MWLNFAWAQEAAQAVPKPSMFEQLMPLLFVVVIFYFLIIRPQQRRGRQQQEFVSALKRGDEVLTSSGILGTIEGLTDRFVTLEVADGVRIRVLKTQITAAAQEEPKK